MKLICQSLSFFNRMGEDAALDWFAEIGFDAVDYSMFQPIQGEFMNQPLEKMLDYYRALREKAEKKGVPFRQMHAPFIGGYEELRPYVEKSIYVCAALDARHIVVHAEYDRRNYDNVFVEEGRRAVLDTYARLIPAALETGVKICVENMHRNWPHNPGQCHMFMSRAEDLLDVVHTLNEMAGKEVFGICLDIGHANLYNNAAAGMIRQLGSELTCLHVQDNDLQADRHILPYMGKTDIDGTFRALHEIGYQGDVTFESERSIETLPLPLMPEMLRYYEKVGRHLIKIAQGEI